MTYDSVLKRMRQCIRDNNYGMSEHAQEEAWNDDLTILDVEHAILTGTIVHTQRDRITNEQKYVLHSSVYSFGPIGIIAKFGPVGELYIITVYSI